MLTKRLVKVGGSYALIIDKPIMELLRLTGDTDFEVTTDGRALKIVPKVRHATREQLEAAMARTFANHAETFAKLAK